MDHNDKLCPTNVYVGQHNENDFDRNEFDDLVNQMKNMTISQDQLSEMAKLCMSEDNNQRFEGIRRFRMMLSVSGAIPIQNVIDCGVVPFFVKALDFGDLQLQFESAWAITNIASGTPEQTEVVVECGAIPRLVNLLNSEREDIREQGMWGIGNIAGDRCDFRDVILNIPYALELFVCACKKSQKPATIRTGVWGLSNLCRGQPRPCLSHVCAVVPYLCEVLWQGVDADTLSDACWALDGISERQQGIDMIIQSGVVTRLISLLAHNEPLVQRPALRVIGQIATGTAEQTQVIINLAGIPQLRKLLDSQRKSVRKDACWTISNIAAGPSSQLQCLIDNNVIPKLLWVFEKDSEIEVKKEAAWALCNACTTHRSDQLEYFLQNNCFQPVCEMLDIDDIKVAEVALDSLHNMLEFGQNRCDNYGLPENPVVDMLKTCNGAQRLCNLRSKAEVTHTETVVERCNELLRLYCRTIDNKMT